jgi:hypothetical protein
MPAEHRVDPSLLDAVATALTRSGTAALEASHDLLAHYGDTGDALTQQAVDTLIDHAADALQALTDSLAETSRLLQATALPATTFPTATSRYAEAGSTTSARSRRSRDHSA